MCGVNGGYGADGGRYPGIPARRYLSEGLSRRARGIACLAVEVPHGVGVDI